MKILRIILLLCLVFCQFASAQKNGVAVKFDEFSSLPNSSPLTERANYFARQLLKEPKTSKAVIIFYNPRKGKYPLNKGEYWADYARGVLANGYDIPQERIVLIDGGYRESLTVEFWIVPLGAEMPEPTPTFDKSEIAICPEINVAGDGFRRDRNLPLNFSVAIKGESPDSKLDFEWNTTAGEITGGQRTNRINVDLTKTNAKLITASVQVKGLNPECDNHSYATTRVGFYPYKVDEFAFVPYSDLSARLDGLFTMLYAEPTMTARIIIYGRRQGRTQDVPRVISNIKQMMLFRGFDTSKVEIIEGGFREEGMIEFYLIPAGVKPPEPTPTIDKKFVVFTDKIKKKSVRRK